MDAKEVRMRCIEAICGMGVREPSRLIRDAKDLEEWVNGAVETERHTRTKAADKG